MRLLYIYSEIDYVIHVLNRFFCITIMTTEDTCLIDCKIKSNQSIKQSIKSLKRNNGRKMLCFLQARNF